MELDTLLFNNENIFLSDFLNAIFLSVIFASVLNLIYFKILNRNTASIYSILFFFLIIPTMVLIISIIKSSLALSLGLVGALSIVRFRTPIKDPEELLFIFFSIALGLGLGSLKFTITSIFFVLVILIIIIFNLFGQKKYNTYNLVFSLNDEYLKTLKDIYALLGENKIDYSITSIIYSNNNYQIALNLRTNNLFKINDIFLNKKIPYELSKTPIVFE